MKRLSSAIIALSLGLGLTAPFCHADKVLIPIAKQGGDLREISLPRTGETRHSVQTRYGAPDSISGPTGDPPISRWNYTDFSVYFESDSVIHSVLKHRPQHPVSETSGSESATPQ